MQLEQQVLLGGYPKDSVAETANADKIGSAGSTGSAGRGTAAGGQAAAAAGSRSFRFDLSPEEIVRARASHEAFIRDAAAGRGQAAAAGGQAAGREAATAGEAAADGGVSKLAEAGNVGREAAAGGQAASHEAIVAARDAAVAKLDPQLRDALANVRESLANHNISPRQVLHELGSPTASDKDFYEIGRIFFEVGKQTHGAGLSPAEQAVADAYIKSYEARMTQGFTRAGRGLTHFIDENSSRAMIDSIKNGTLDANSLEYIRGLARSSGLTPESQALVEAARSAGLIP